MIITRCDICSAETDQPLYKNDLGIGEIREPKWRMPNIVHVCHQCGIELHQKDQEIIKEQTKERHDRMKRFITSLRAEKRN